MQDLLLECAVRALLIAAATGLVLLAFRTGGAALRHTAWLAVVVWMLLLPGFTSWVPKAPLRLLPAHSPISRIAAASGASEEVPDFDLSTDESGGGWNWLLIAYLSGVGLLLVRLAIGAARTRSLLRSARTQDGYWTSSACAAPVTAGWLRPKVILPEACREWPESQRAAALAHEREHARRRDPLVQLVALVNRAVFWFHPLAWWLERRLSSLAEEACDAAVLAAGHNPYDYSNCLLAMARAVEANGTRIDALGMAMPGSDLPRRIRRILSPGPVRRASRLRTALAASGCLLLSAALAAGTVEPAAEPISQPPPQANSRLVVLYFNPITPDAAGAAQQYVRTRLQPADRVALMLFRDGQTRILQDFTADRGLLLQAIRQLPAAQSGAPDSRLQLEGLRQAVRTLAPIQGRKALVYFSRPIPGTEDIKPIVDAAVRANVAFFPIDVGPAR